MAEWGYDDRVHRYRNLTSGRFLPKRDVVALRDAVVDAAGREARDLARRVVAGDISPDAFRQGMRLAIRNSHVAQYAFGRGGVRSLTQSDFGRIGNTLRRQYAFLERFLIDVQNGTVTEAQAANRANLYINGGVSSFERGHAAAWGLNLPVQPGDGGTPCLGNCRCHWDIRETETTIDAYWRTESDPCSGCMARGERYAPYSTFKPYAVPDATPVRLAAIRRVA